MDIQGMSGGYAPVYDKTTFGAAVVGKTRLIDNMAV